MARLDDDGQPITRAFNWHRNLKKSLESLLGLCQGMLADNRLNAEEILFLDAWLKDNEEIARAWPGDVIAQRVRTILADGAVTEEEAEDLKDTLARMLGGTLQESGSACGMATRLPVDDVDRIVFDDRVFCLTGKFIYGPRRKCEEAILDHGGKISCGVVKNMDYLIVGTLASRDWAYTSHGRKIEKAVSYRDDGAKILIVAEERWTKFL